MERSQRRKKTKNIPELLAPAGTKEAFIAAVEAGADAVYIGGHEFNARMSATNFSVEEIREACDFAHKRGVKVHVTLNTLIEDEELEEALRYAEELWEIGVDALIIQDLGIAHLIHNHIPDFPIHMSTQGTIYNKEGVQVCRDLGFSRVVLARELSLDEVREICEQVDEEIEVFCHGALCYCYSGQCQMSRALGGRSANRGACAQPCRMKYGKNGYALSPKDMDVLEYLPWIAEAGVASLKIEGRMKSPEYVAVVTSIYRKYLDKLEAGEDFLAGSEVGGFDGSKPGCRSWAVEPEDVLALRQVFSRGFTDSAFSGEEDPCLMSQDSPKNKGLPIGRVAGNVGKSRFIKEGRYYLDIEPDEDAAYPGNPMGLTKGDVVEVQGAEGSSFAVTYIEELWEGLFRLGDAKGEYEEGTPVYRVISSKLMSSYSDYYSNKDWHSGKFIRKKELEGDVTTDGAGMIGLVLRDKESGTSFKVEGGPYSESDAPGSMESRMKGSLAKTGGTPFKVGAVRFHGSTSLDIPVKDINELRRKALGGMEESYSVRRERVELPDEVFEHDALSENNDGGIELRCLKPDNPGIELYCMEPSDVLGDAALQCLSAGIKVQVLFPACEVDRIDEYRKGLAEPSEVVFVPYISNVSKGLEEELLSTKKDLLADYCLANKVPIYIGNLSHIKLLEDATAKGVELRYDFGMNIYNEASKVAMQEMGVAAGAPSLESMDYHFGPYPLMTIQHSPVAEVLENGKGRRFRIVKPEYSDQARLVDVTSMDMAGDLSRAIALAKEEGTVKRFYII